MYHLQRCQRGHNGQFAFFFLDGALFRSMFPDLVEAFERETLSENCAIDQGRKRIVSIVRGKLSKWRPIKVDAAPDIAGDVLVRLAKTGLGNAFDPDIGTGWSLVNKVTNFVIRETFNKEIRAGYEQFDFTLQTAADPSPVDAAFDRERLASVKERYLKLSGRQRWAVWQRYPFLALIEDDVSQNVYIDRHRGINRLVNNFINN